MHYCARAGNADVLLEMVKHLPAADVQVCINMQASSGWSPLLVASEQGHLEVLRILLQNNARVDVFDEVHILLIIFSSTCFTHGKAILKTSGSFNNITSTLLLQTKLILNISFFIKPNKNDYLKKKKKTSYFWHICFSSKRMSDSI